MIPWKSAGTLRWLHKMAIRTGILFCTLLLGSLALPVPDEEQDMSIFFETVDRDWDPSERIVGGTVAQISQHPWMVAFTTGGNARSMHCGGSILNARTVLTAAHCVVPVRNNLGNTRAVVGTNRFASGGVAHNINGQATHPQYNANTIKNDIGCIYTSTNIAFNNNVRAVALTFANIGGGVQARVAGFGRTSANGPVSQQLLEITVPTMGGPQCVTAAREASQTLGMRAPAVDPNIEICTFHSRGRGTCRGDSGSALTRNDNRQQIGIVSWGFPCALGAPDVYVRVSAFQTWIRQNTR